MRESFAQGTMGREIGDTPFSPFSRPWFHRHHNACLLRPYNPFKTLRMDDLVRVSTLRTLAIYRSHIYIQLKSTRWFWMGCPEEEKIDNSVIPSVFVSKFLTLKNLHSFFFFFFLQKCKETLTRYAGRAKCIWEAVLSQELMECLCSVIT